MNELNEQIRITKGGISPRNGVDYRLTRATTEVMEAVTTLLCEAEG